MKKESLNEQNIRNILLGVFFASFSFSLANYFLPFYLKEQGLTALQIGGLFTVSVALGSLLFGVLFSLIIRKINLRSGLIFGSLLNSMSTLFLGVFPSISGSVGNRIFSNLSSSVGSISVDTSIQHNMKKGGERQTSVRWGIVDGLGLISGLIFSLILITYVGFMNSFYIFSAIALLSIFFYSRVSDKTRFKSKQKSKLPKIPNHLKLLLFSELIYWLALSSSFSLVITFLVSEKLSGGLLDIGILFIALYTSMNLTLILSKGKLNKFNETKTSILGMSLLLLSAVVVILSKNFYLILFAFILEGIGAGIWVPSKTALQWKHTKKENREKVSGWLYGWRRMVQVLGPLFGGFLITYYGINSPFYFKAVISVFSILIYFYLLRKY